MLRSLLAFLLSRSRQVAPVGGIFSRVVSLLEADRVEAALAAATAAARDHPHAYEAQLALGLAWQKSHEPQRALACYALAEKLRAGDPELHDLRGVTLQEYGLLEQAMAEFERALALQPGFVRARFHRGLLNLLRGEFALGWEDYELRRADAHSALHGARRSGLPLPHWDGSALEGRTILVRREQGLGDEIMFASIVPQLAAGAGRVLLECDPRLQGLLARSFPAVKVVGDVSDSLAAPEADVETGAASLARYLRRGVADFPRHGGYLLADPARIARWRERLATLGEGIKVGISWAGGVRRTRRALRSIALDEWLPILARPGVRFVSLQYTAEAKEELEALRLRHGIQVTHWDEVIADYEETAALTSVLDLVISVCTSLVHLGGALGRPVWVMAPFSPEWRYGSSGPGMPWYPSVRIFRQTVFAQWQPVIASVAAQLAGR